MYYVKKILVDIVDHAYAGHPNLDRYRRFYVEVVTDKEYKSKNGDYHAKDRHLRIFDQGRSPENIVKTAIHELAHHIDTVNRGHSDHSRVFYQEYIRLLTSAIDMGIFSLEDFLETERDSQDGNKVRRMLRGYKPKASTYKADEVLIAVTDGYDQKDRLKKAGYSWNPSSKAWQKEVGLPQVKEEAAVLNDMGLQYRIDDARQLHLGRRMGDKKNQG